MSGLCGWFRLAHSGTGESGGDRGMAAAIKPVRRQHERNSASADFGARLRGGP